MTPDEMISLANECEARAANATEGPWTWIPSREVYGQSHPRMRMPVLSGKDGFVCDFGEDCLAYPEEGNSGTPPEQVDAEFIAAARTDIPRLCTALREAATELRGLYKECTHFEQPRSRGNARAQVEDLSSQLNKSRAVVSFLKSEYFELCGRDQETMYDLEQLIADIEDSTR